MRKLLLGSVVLSTFAIALIIFQMSCEKVATAQQTTTTYVLPAATTTTLGGVIIGSGLTVNSAGLLSVNVSTNGGATINQNLILTAYRGSDSTLAVFDYNGKLIRTMQPSSSIIDFNTFRIKDAKFSPDGKIIVLCMENKKEASSDAFFTMDALGNNVKSIITENGRGGYFDLK